VTPMPFLPCVAAVEKPTTSIPQDDDEESEVAAATAAAAAKAAAASAEGDAVDVEKVAAAARGMSLPFEPMSLSFKDINYFVPMPPDNPAFAVSVSICLY
jgi:hypothetical protein